MAVCLQRLFSIEENSQALSAKAEKAHDSAWLDSDQAEQEANCLENHENTNGHGSENISARKYFSGLQNPETERPEQSFERQKNYLPCPITADEKFFATSIGYKYD